MPLRKDLKEKKELGKHKMAPPVYQKHRLLLKKYKRSRLPCDKKFNGRGILTVRR